MASRDELLIIARLKNEVSRPIQDVNRDLQKLTRELAAADKATAAEARQLRALGREAKATTKASKELGGRWAENGKRLSAFVSLPLVAVLGAAAKAQSALAEQTSKTNVIFGAQAKSIIATAEAARGISQRAFLEGAGNFGALFAPLGIAREQAALMSTTLVKLAVDLASFNEGTSVADALTALRSGLVGETEPLRVFGVRLSAARIEQEAYAAGLARTGDELTDVQKVQAAYRVILQDTKVAQGDFGRTADSAANSIRDAQAQIENAGATIGQKLTPALARGAQMVAGLAEAFGQLPSGAQTVAVAIAGVGIAVGPIAYVIGNLKKLLAWLKLNELAGSRLGPTLARSAGIAAKAFALAGAALTGFSLGRAYRNSQTDKYIQGLLADQDLLSDKGRSDAIAKLRTVHEARRGEGVGINIGGNRLFLNPAAQKNSEELFALKAAIGGLEAEQALAAKTAANLDAELGDVSGVKAAVGAMGGLARKTETAAEKLDRFRTAWDQALGRFLGADEAAIAAKQALDSLAEALADSETSATDRAERALGAVRQISESVQADVTAGRVAGGPNAIFQEQIDRLRAAAKDPALRGAGKIFADAIARLEDGKSAELVATLGVDALPALRDLGKSARPSRRRSWRCGSASSRTSRLSPGSPSRAATSSTRRPAGA